MTVSMGNGVDLGNLVTAEKDSTTNRISISGLESIPLDITQGTLYNQANTLALIGDSRLALAYFSDANNNVTYCRSIVEWGLALSKRRLTLIGKFAVSGSYISTDMSGGGNYPGGLGQIKSAIASGAAHLLINGGVNDLLSGVTLTTLKAAYESIVSQAIAANMTVWACTIMGANAGGSYSVATQSKVLAFNDWLRQLKYVSGYKTLNVVDCASASIDPASATAASFAGHLYAADGLHPTNRGAYAQGKELARMWSATLPEVSQLLSSNADDYAYSTTCTNLLSNGLMLVGSPTATGFVLTNTGTGANTPSIVSRSDGFGNDQQIICTSGAAQDKVTLTSPDVYTRVSNGDILIAECEVTVAASPVHLGSIRLALTAVGTTTYSVSSIGAVDATEDVALSEGFTIIMRTNPLTINTSFLVAPLTSVKAAVLTNFVAGSGTVTIKVGRFSIRKIG